jgi:hypothetical protein
MLLALQDAPCTVVKHMHMPLAAHGPLGAPEHTAAIMAAEAVSTYNVTATEANVVCLYAACNAVFQQLLVLLMVCVPDSAFAAAVQCALTGNHSMLNMHLFPSTSSRALTVGWPRSVIDGCSCQLRKCWHCIDALHVPSLAFSQEKWLLTAGARYAGDASAAVPNACRVGLKLVARACCCCATSHAD